MIKISSTEQQLAKVFKSQKFRLSYPLFVTTKAKSLIDEIIISSIKRKMRLYDFSKKIINAVRIANLNISLTTGEITFDVISDYKDSESRFDVAKAREEGTKKHKTAPVKKKANSWVVRGIRFFSKGHWVRGIVESRIVKNTMIQNMPHVQRLLDEATAQRFQVMTA